MNTPTIVNVGYRSTNYWVVGQGRSRILFDLGWPGSFGKMQAMLRRKDVPLSEIRYALASHYHIDHAGLGEELKEAGVPLLVIDLQVTAIPLMEQWTKPQDNYREIQPAGNIVISCAESRDLLATIGIAGEIVHTPGHSNDSVSLLLDNGAVFTGDLPAPWLVGRENPTVVAASWESLATRGAQRIYPGHGGIRPFPA